MFERASSCAGSGVSGERKLHSSSQFPAQFCSWWLRQLRFGNGTPRVRCGHTGWRTDEGSPFTDWNHRYDRRGDMLLYASACRVARGCRLLGIDWLSRHRPSASTRNLLGHNGIRSMETQQDAVILQSTITCPECGHVETDTMPTDACQWFYDCKGCKTVLKPLPGDCCVYCSYATVPCPPIQAGDDCCG